MRHAVLAALLSLAIGAAVASEPGQPLDCSDFVILDSRLSCSVEVPFPCLANPNNTNSPLLSCFAGNMAATDNEGGILYWDSSSLAPVVSCDGEFEGLYRHALIRLAAGVATVVAYVDDRCGLPPTDADTMVLTRLVFDSKGGTLSFGPDHQEDRSGTYHGGQRFVFHGFSTDFDILQTFTPSANALGFRVPYMPEGMAGADHFDTYWGDLAHPIDFTQAHPLQCDYPLAAPADVGDYLTVPDTVPTPAPGQGVYYVTAATYQGATRYGRKTTAGHLSGRDPAVLPVCGP